MTSGRIINLAAERQRRGMNRAPLNPLIWPAMLAANFLCWGLVGLTLIHLVPAISEALRSR